MTYTDNLGLFAVLLLGIIIVPGMDMLFVLANALTGGRSAGLSATAGLMAGGATHTLIGALAVGVLTRLEPAFLMPILFAGAAYMAWIGFTLLRSSITVTGTAVAATRQRWVAFRQGLLTCLSNPKAYLFVFSVYPQFIKPQYGPIWQQAAIMGAMTVLVQGGIYGGLALLAGKSRDFLVSSPGMTIFVGRAAGALFIVVAIATAWHGWSEGQVSLR